MATVLASALDSVMATTQVMEVIGADTAIILAGMVAIMEVDTMVVITAATIDRALTDPGSVNPWLPEHLLRFSGSYCPLRA